MAQHDRSGACWERPGPCRRTWEGWSVARKWWTLVVTCLAIFMLLVNITIVNVALPAIATDLDASFSDLQWVIDAYALTLAGLLLTAGTLADRLGRRAVFAVGLLHRHRDRRTRRDLPERDQLGRRQTA